MAKKLKKIAKQKKELQAKVESGVERISPLKRTKIRVVGIGGGGGNIVSELARRVRKATFLAANTDLQALKGVSRKVERFSFGQGSTRGLGTGMNPELGEIAGQNEKERIKKILQGQDLIIFIACLGGGTGSGAAPIFAKISQSLGSLSYGIFTLPFKFEGERKLGIAKKALEILRPKLNAITVLPNERIFQIIDKTTPLKEAFSAINKSLAQSLESLIETIYQPGLINIDFADLRTVLGGSRGRLAYLNTLSLPRKEGTAKEAVERAIISPLYPYGIKGAKGVLFNIVGEKKLSLEEVSQISKTISEKANPEAKIVFGIQPFSQKRGAGYQNIIKTTIFATGCAAKIFSDEVKKTSRPKRRKKIRKIEVKVKPLRKPLKKKKSISKAKVRVRRRPKVKRVKIKKPEKKLPPSPKVKTSKKSKLLKKQAKKEKPPTSEGRVEIKVRKNALQLKKEVEEEEKEMLEKEKFWEMPAFLRTKK